MLLTGACTGGSGKKQSAPSRAPANLRSGGTLYVGVFRWNGAVHHDPTVGVTDLPGLDQCCLLRTLMSYNGSPTAQGGAEVRPDLASGMPQVSVDDLTWTFHLKPGLFYAPPLQGTPIVAHDIIRAVERSLSPTPKRYVQFFGTMLGFGSQYFTPVVQGAQEYAEGRASAISGLEAPDPSTLRVHLTRPFGDLAYLLALESTAPIPPNRFHPDARFGVAEGHDIDGYGKFLVSSGPYMIEGSQKLDFSKPPDQQQPASGLDPLVLVRNPSWKRSTDHIRPAYPDRIEFTAYDHNYTLREWIDPDPELRLRARLAMAKEVDDGKLDVVLDSQAPYDQVQEYLADPALRKRLVINEFGDIRFLSLNTALPPFDDVHVRRAVNYAIDKQRILDLWKLGQNSGAIYDHMAPDATENNLLVSYQPYASPSHAGDLMAAMEEMRLSSYDSNGDGRCDAAVCRHVFVRWRQEAAYPQIAPVVKEDLAKIGIDLKLKIGSGFDMYNWCFDPAVHPTLCQVGLSADYPSGSTFFGPTTQDGALGFSLLGASASQLRKWKYPVASVPNVEAWISDCETRIGSAAVSCWASFDQYLMTEVVPAVPLLTDTAPWTFSSRVTSFSFDQVTGAPALDRISVAS